MGHWNQWPEYVPVAERRAKAKRELQKLRKKGVQIQPIEAFRSRKIAQSFWGQAWCEHLESFSDYASRLPRGRTYVRNGSVCHLEINTGQIHAQVSGSYVYKVDVTIPSLSESKWRRIKQACTGEIGSILELLEGNISDHVMAIVADPDDGLFPQDHEISFSCSCPDWAVMCKHVAAVLYGVGRRLDDEPDLLFHLRGVDPQELIEAELDIPTDADTDDSEVLDDADLSGIFGVEMDGMELHFDDDMEAFDESSEEAHTPEFDDSTDEEDAPEDTDAESAEYEEDEFEDEFEDEYDEYDEYDESDEEYEDEYDEVAELPAQEDEADDFAPTGAEIKRLRKLFDYTAAEFGEQVGVSASTVYKWEKTKGPVTLQPEPKRRLKLLF